MGKKHPYTTGKLCVSISQTFPIPWVLFHFPILWEIYRETRVLLHFPVLWEIYAETRTIPICYDDICEFFPAMCQKSV